MLVLQSSDKSMTLSTKLRMLIDDQITMNIVCTFNIFIVVVININTCHVVRLVFLFVLFLLSFALLLWLLLLRLWSSSGLLYDRCFFDNGFFGGCFFVVIFGDRLCWYIYCWLTIDNRFFGGWS
eukprot:TRINITY_DN653_c1_g3_i2.p2 TRINITY_DN653_c1_g3~~TRINITY_DN653_c1_g3_i2.p2  ORF type:complete len:124 (+),score=10.67 TRINITY_DN653_c1_g3_i2:67-438(+)